MAVREEARLFGQAVRAILTKLLFLATINPVVEMDQALTYSTRFKNATTILMAALRDETLAGPSRGLNVLGVLGYRGVRESPGLLDSLDGGGIFALPNLEGMLDSRISEQHRGADADLGIRIE